MQNSENPQTWLDFALIDYQTAKHLADTMHPQPLEIICFHCQQCAEKSVKALMLSKPIKNFRSHDIGLLLDTLQSEFGIESDETLYKKGAFLTPFGVAVRYPHTLELDETVMKAALEYASEFYHWAKEQIDE